MAKLIHADIRIEGIVQGVGFRPFVHRLVRERGLSGNIRNTAYGALLRLEGEEEGIHSLMREISENPPPLAFVEAVEADTSEMIFGYSGFEIAASEDGEPRTLISPDTAVCDECVRELFDPSDRRWRYPFINCTNCGPRFTITRDIPYDRKNTTMAEFQMCSRCASEYRDIENRRYHAQPDCCGECGPRLRFITCEGKEPRGEPLELAVQLLREGRILAVKGLGGIHLACLCGNENAVNELRLRKRRDEKPFAVMCRDLAAAHKYARISESEERLLTSHRRPIVLLEKAEKDTLMHISENRRIGIMLPYTPVHHLLMESFDALVMTSANISDMPIIYKDDEAFNELSGVADAFLTNDREIHTRCDDSLVWEYRGREYFARRSRGYVPHPVCVESELKNILACGAEQKASFALSEGRHVFPSQHIGDLKNLETLEAYEAQIAHFENIFGIKPEALVCDLHPDYMSTEYAVRRGEQERIPVFRVQHHHAHMTACMADNRFDGKCIGIVWDGTGLGTDGTIWGSEFLVGDFSGFERRGTIRGIKLPGGDRAVKEIYRVGDSLLAESGIECRDAGVSRLLASNINCPVSHGMGRLFDGVAAILGIKSRVSYEGQGAMLLEAAAGDNPQGRVYRYELLLNENRVYELDWRKIIRAIYEEKESGVPLQDIAAVFMDTLVSFAAETAQRISEETGIRTLALSGGTFQNMYILSRLQDRLENDGFTVLTHRRVSTNDEGISLGQIMTAQKLMEGEG